MEGWGWGTAVAEVPLEGGWSRMVTRKKKKREKRKEKKEKENERKIQKFFNFFKIFSTHSTINYTKFLYKCPKNTSSEYSM